MYWSYRFSKKLTRIFMPKEELVGLTVKKKTMKMRMVNVLDAKPNE